MSDGAIQTILQLMIWGLLIALPIFANWAWQRNRQERMQRLENRVMAPPSLPVSRLSPTRTARAAVISLALIFAAVAAWRWTGLGQSGAAPPPLQAGQSGVPVGTPRAHEVDPRAESTADALLVDSVVAGTDPVHVMFSGPWAGVSLESLALDRQGRIFFTEDSDGSAAIYLVTQDGFRPFFSPPPDQRVANGQRTGRYELTSVRAGADGNLYAVDGGGIWKVDSQGKGQRVYVWAPCSSSGGQPFQEQIPDAVHCFDLRDFQVDRQGEIFLLKGRPGVSDFIDRIDATGKESRWAGNPTDLAAHAGTGMAAALGERGSYIRYLSSTVLALDGNDNIYLATHLGCEQTNANGACGPVPPQQPPFDTILHISPEAVVEILVEHGDQNGDAALVSPGNPVMAGSPDGGFIYVLGERLLRVNKSGVVTELGHVVPRSPADQLDTGETPLLLGPRGVPYLRKGHTLMRLKGHSHLEPLVVFGS